MRTLFAYVLSGIVIVLLCGCLESNTEEKRQFSIQHVKQAYLNSRSPIFRQWGVDILAALSSPKASTLRSPVIASATLGIDRDGEYRFYIFWLEDKPSINQVELWLGRTNSAIIVNVLDSNTAENTKSSNVSVVMVASWNWSAADVISRKLGMVDNVSELKVRLLRDGTTETGWWPISFYRLDHWMGSKEVIEVTNGKAAFNSDD